MFAPLSDELPFAEMHPISRISQPCGKGSVLIQTLSLRRKLVLPSQMRRFQQPQQAHA